MYYPPARFDDDASSGFYRAMLVVLARYCYRKSSVRPSVRLSVTLWYRGRICGVSLKVIT